MTEKQAWTLGGVLLLAAWFAYVTYLFIKWLIKKKKKTEQEEKDDDYGDNDIGNDGNHNF